MTDSTVAQLVSEDWSVPLPGQLSPVLLFSMIPYGVGYPLGQMESADLAVSAPKSLCTSASSLAGQQEKLCFINIILILKPEHSIVSAAKENINCHNQDKHYIFAYIYKYVSS